ncbi:MAG TPA: DUF4175 family protein, partial [Terriglobia bacterium]|nr:DUF4175 family protein [Terriglobia bacterium]
MWPLLKLFGVVQGENDFTMAERIGHHFPGVRDTLTNFLQLQQEAARGNSLFSAELLAASFSDFARLVASVDFSRAIDESLVRTMRKWFLTSGAGLVMFCAMFPSAFPSAMVRLALYRTEFVPPPKYTFVVHPGNAEVVKGQNVDVRVQLSTIDELVFKPAVLELFYRSTGQEAFDQMPLKQDSASAYHGTLQNIQNTAEYYVRASDTYSQRYILKVLDRPVIRSLRVRLDFPEYSRLPGRLQDEFAGDITALAGTRVTLSGVASKVLEHGAIVFSQDSAVSLAVVDNKFSGRFMLRDDGTYYLAIADLDSLSNIDPVHYTLKVLPDDWPTVSIIAPGKNLDIVGDQSLRLLMHIEDDFGFSRLRLGYRLVHSRYEGPQKDYSYRDVPLPQGRLTQADVPYLWDLSTMNLVPEDVVEYFAEVSDNDVIKGPKSARSDLYQLRLPSLQEVFSDANKEHDQSLSHIKEAVEEAKQLREDIESINNDIKQNKDI